MRTRNVIRAAGVAAVAATLLTGCGDYGDSGGSSRYGNTSSAKEESPSTGPTVGGYAKVAVDALDTAEADVTDGVAFELELDRADKGDRVWDVMVASGTKSQYEVRVSTDGDEVLSKHKDDDLDDDIAELAGVKLSAQDATKRAAEDYDGDVTSLEFDVTRDGTPSWQVTLDDAGKVTQYRLDANTGEKLGSKPGDD